MKILSMTATFGKLEHETITFREGLNIIHAPNEWGKSTWCAFLVAMLYGVSTSSRTKKDFLADKERFAPWSGKPMSGSVRLVWNDRDITIERSPKGKIPMGNFRAYETETGVAVTELTAENCGNVLLGVEREVFTRAGFLRFSDLPVADDEALRRRLNALVTTGDESDAGDELAQKLKKLKNACKHNNTGLIPQVQTQKQQLEGKLEQLQQLQQQLEQQTQKQRQLEEYNLQLDNHKAALEYEKCQESRRHMERSRQELEAAKAELEALEAACSQLPTAQSAQAELHRLEQVEAAAQALQEQERQLPPLPEKPETPPVFGGMTPEETAAAVDMDVKACLRFAKPSAAWLVAGIVLLVAGIGLFFVHYLAGIVALAAGAALAVTYAIKQSMHKGARRSLQDRYGTEDTPTLHQMVDDYRRQMQLYQLDLKHAQDARDFLEQKKRELERTSRLLTGDQSRQQYRTQLQQALEQRRLLEHARSRYNQARDHASAMNAVILVAEAPKMPDSLTLSWEQTALAMQQTQTQLLQLREASTRCVTMMEALGDKGALERALEQVNGRLQRLEDYYGALSLAQDTLTRAATELQRRFAPVISKRAKELFGKLTEGRYDRLLLAEDLSMEVAAVDEDTTHGVLWRSDGTADSLYLALRLAVAEELTPNAPLVLDDALVRLDDKRLAAAMEILKEYARGKQVILFTCQQRELEFA